MLASNQPREVPTSTGCLLGSTGSLESSQPRMIAEVDLKHLKEYFAERCMFEVMKLEGGIFEKVDKIESKLERQIREMGLNHNNELQSLENRIQQQSESDAQKVHRRLETLRQEQRAEAAEVLSTPSSRQAEMLAQMTQHQAQLDAMEASLTDFRRELGEHLQHRHEQIDAVRVAEDRWSRWEVVHNQQLQAMSEQAAGCLAEHRAKMHEITAALEARQMPIEVRTSGEQANILQRIEEVSRQCIKCDGKLEDVKQDQLCELVTLRGRFEVDREEQEAKLARLESITAHLNKDLSHSVSPETEVVALLNKRVEALGVDLAALSQHFEASLQGCATAGETRVSGLDSCMDVGENAQSKWSDRFKLLESLQEDVALQGAAIRTLKEQMESNSSQSSMRAALSETRMDVGLLASQLAEEIQERQSTLLDVSRRIKGQLAEEVSTSASYIMERLEKQLATEISKERVRTEQLVNERMPRKDCLDRLADMATTSSGSGDHENVGANSEIARSVGRIVGDMEAELRVELTSRINALQAEVNCLQTEVMSHTTSVKMRLAAVESTALKPEARPSNPGSDDAHSSSSCGTCELAPPRMQDIAAPAAVSENMGKGISQTGTSRNSSSPKLTSSASQEFNQERATSMKCLLSKDLKHTLENLAQTVHQRLADPTQQGISRPSSTSRSRPRPGLISELTEQGTQRPSSAMRARPLASCISDLGPGGGGGNSMSNSSAAGSGDPNRSATDPASLSTSSQASVQQYASESHQTIYRPSHQGLLNLSNQARQQLTAPCLSEIIKGGSLTLKVGNRASSPTMPPEANDKGISLATFARLGSDQAEPGRQSTQADPTGQQSALADASLASDQALVGGGSMKVKIGNRAASAKVPPEATVPEVGLSVCVRPESFPTDMGQLSTHSASIGQQSILQDANKVSAQVSMGGGPLQAKAGDTAAAGRTSLPTSSRLGSLHADQSRQSVHADQRGRQITPADDSIAGSQQRAMVARSHPHMTSGTLSGCVAGTHNNSARGRQTHSLQLPVHSSTSPMNAPHGSRQQAQGTAPNLSPGGTMPQLGSAAARMPSRIAAELQTQLTPRSPVAQFRGAG